jgi:hypothetical protein
MTHEELTRDTNAITSMVAGLRAAESFYAKEHQDFPVAIAVTAGHALFSALIRTRGVNAHWRFDLATGRLDNVATRVTPIVGRAPHEADPWSYTAVLGPTFTASAIPAEQATS